MKQKDDEDAEKVSHADNLCPYEEASDSNHCASTLAMYSSYSGYSTDDLEQVKVVGLRWAGGNPLVKVKMTNEFFIKSCCTLGAVN